MRNLFILLLSLFLFQQSYSQELLTDTKFQSGFHVLSPTLTNVGYAREGIIQYQPATDPAWELCQNQSTSSVINLSPVVEPSGFYRWTDSNKDFRFGPIGAEDYDIYFGVNSQNEYGGTYNTNGVYFPHLLIQQRISAPFTSATNHGVGCPPISDLTSLVFNIDAKLLYNQTIIQSGYDSDYHAAQFLIYFTVQNLNPNSAGYGKIVWLGIPVYDDRYDAIPGGGVQYDISSQTLINTIPYYSCANETMHNGNWVHFNVDILPYVHQALQAAWDNGYLTESTNLADYKIGGMNMGWELPGMNISTMITKGMSLVANTNAPSTPINNAEFVAQAFSTQLTAGETFYAEIRFKNTGNTTWQAGNNYSLGSFNPNDNTTWGTNRITLPHDVAPGQEITFPAYLTAPNTAGTYNFQWRLVQDGVEWFGEESDNVVVTVNTATPVNASEFLSQTVPSQVQQSENFSVTLTFKNTGNTTWQAGSNYSLGSFNPNDNTTWGVQRVQLPTDVVPGQMVTITANLTAPAIAGNYNFQWQMVQDGVEWFGASSENRVISVVSNSTPVNNSQFIAQAFPTQVNAGEQFYAEIRFKNTGNTTWQAGNYYSLGSQNTQDNNTWGTSRIVLPNDVAPGQEVTIATNLTAPTVAGTYAFQWKMVQDGVEWFGETSTNAPITVVENLNLVNNAEFVAQAFSTQLTAGEQFYAEIRFKNTGNTTWQAGSYYNLGSQNAQDNTTWGTNRITLPVDVAPGEEITFSANLTAPNAAGTYGFQWRLVQDGVEWFGQASNNVYVTVSQPASQLNNAEFISQTVPTQVIAGNDFNISLRFKNTGTTTWSSANNYLLGALNPVSMAWGTNNINLPYDVAPGQEVTLNKTVTAPTTTGVYTYQWQMLQYGVEWFGQTSNVSNINVVENVNTSNSIQLIADSKFQTGFYVVNEDGATVGNINTSTGNNPAWELMEIRSQSSLVNMNPVVEPSGFYKWSNNFKDFRVGPENAEDYDYYVGINSIEEWNDTYMPVTELERWPALLIQQRLSAPFLPQNHHGPGCPTLAEMSSLEFSMDAKLLYNYTVIREGYDPNHHAAQFPIYFTVQNLNPNSVGYGQYLWLGILVFDDRYQNFQGFQMMDVHTQALIWTLPDAASRTESLHSGNWVELRVDLLPYAIQALQSAWNNGIMTASTNLADYRIGGMNMGWEMPGLNVSTMVTRDLSLIANTNTNALLTYNGDNLGQVETNNFTPHFQVVTDVNETMSNSSITIYPNPAKDFVIVDGINDSNANISILDITGKVINFIFHTERSEKSVKLNISDLQNGVYLIKIETLSNSTIKKFVKE